MRAAHLIIVLTLFCAGGLLADDSHHEARRLVAEGEIQPLAVILDRIQAEQAGSILEAELDREGGRMVYEIEMLDNEGVVWEIKVDAVSGKILKREAED